MVDKIAEILQQTCNEKIQQLLEEFGYEVKVNALNRNRVETKIKDKIRHSSYEEIDNILKKYFSNE
jgi:hypothetical protein